MDNLLLLANFETAVRVHEMKGSQPPEDHEAIEAEYVRAQKALTEALTNPKLANDCMINQVWFMRGSPVSELIKHAEGVYKAEAVAQNSNVEFGTDDNEIWWAHDVPFFGRVQLQRFVEHGIVEWDIHFNDCWQGPFESKAKAILHLQECIAEKLEEQTV
ncbi:hypothetical protein ACN1NW_000433 [Acinetobacter baumannii]